MTDEISIEAKLAYIRNERIILTIGEYTLARSYQLALNIDNKIDSEYIQKKQFNNYNYYEISCEPSGSDEKTLGSVYNFKIKCTDTFSIIN